MCFSSALAAPGSWATLCVWSWDSLKGKLCMEWSQLIRSLPNRAFYTRWVFLALQEDRVCWLRSHRSSRCTRIHRLKSRSPRSLIVSLSLNNHWLPEGDYNVFAICFHLLFIWCPRCNITVMSPRRQIATFRYHYHAQSYMTLTHSSERVSSSWRMHECTICEAGRRFSTCVRLA